MKQLLLSSCLLLSVSTLSHLYGKGKPAITAQQIMAKAEQATKIKGSESLTILTIINKDGKKRVRKIAQVTKLYDDGTEKRLIRFLHPADVKGTGLLTFDNKDKDDDIWLFMPALRKTRRIIASEKSKRFMGSEFSYADMNFPTLSEFNFISDPDETVLGVNCYRIQNIPKTQDIADEYGFSKKVVWIDKEKFIIRQALFFDSKMKNLKMLEVKKITTIDAKNKKYRPTHLEMTNFQTNRKSIIQVMKIDYNKNVKDSYFTTGYLEKP